MTDKLEKFILLKSGKSKIQVQGNRVIFKRREDSDFSKVFRIMELNLYTVNAVNFLKFFFSLLLILLFGQIKLKDPSDTDIRKMEGKIN